MSEKQIGFRLKSRVGDKEMGLFTRQLSVMLDSGMQGIEALRLLSENRKNKYFGVCIRDAAEAVNRGASFSAAFRQHPDVFSPLFVAMVGAGEQSGKLIPMLEHLTAYYEEQTAAKNKITQALLYPAIVFCVAVFVVCFLMFYVVPIFAEVLQSAGGELPVSTQILLYGGRAAALLIPCIIAVILLLILSGRLLKHDPKFSEKRDRLILKLPIIGKIKYDSECIRLAEVMHQLIGSGVDLLTVLNICGDVVKNHAFKKAISQIRASVSQGYPLYFGFRETGLFEPVFCQMIETGERSGTLVQVLEKVKKYYKDALEDRVKKLSTVLEPVLLLIVGALVLFVVLSVMTPIFDLYENYATML